MTGAACDLGSTTMVEVRNLTPDAEVPKGDDWVVVELRNGAYFLTGRANGRPVEAHVAPSGFADPDAAIRAATWWAEYLEAPVIYIKTASRLERVKPSDARFGAEGRRARARLVSVLTGRARELEPV